MMNNEEIKTLFVLKYGRPDLYDSEWMRNLPSEILSLLVPDKFITVDGTNERHVKVLSLFIYFNRMSVTYDAQMRFEQYVFDSYASHIHKQRRAAFFQKIKDFFK